MNLAHERPHAAQYDSQCSSMRKETAMSLNVCSQECPQKLAYLGTATNDAELLAQWGFNGEEAASLLWLQQWYQSGGSDRTAIVRNLEFLKLLVKSGELEL